MADREMEIKPGLWLVWDNMNLSLEEVGENTKKNAKNPYVRRKVAGYANNLGDLLCSYERNKFMALECETLEEMAERQISAVRSRLPLLQNIPRLMKNATP